MQMRSKQIPDKSVYVTGREANLMADAMSRGKLSGDGFYTARCRNLLKQKIGCHDALLTHSCTAALEMAALLLDLSPGDEVIMPSFTFSSTATAFVLRGATPVFVDIEPQTLCMNPEEARKAVTCRTKAIVPVHYAGLVCDMEAIMALGRKHNLLIVEDAAQSLGSSRNGKAAGSFGELACLSFHESKNIQCGEGGALLINDPGLVERALILREKGTNRSAFLQGQVDKYTWVDIGSSYLPNELTTAFLLAQLEEEKAITQSRVDACKKYFKNLKPLHDAGKITFYDWDSPNIGNGHIFWILTKDLEERIGLQKYLQKRNIFTFFHYVPLHSSPAGKKYGRPHGNLEVTDSVYDRLLRLPMQAYMSDADIEVTCETIFDFYSVP